MNKKTILRNLLNKKKAKYVLSDGYPNYVANKEKKVELLERKILELGMEQSDLTDNLEEYSKYTSKINKIKEVAAKLKKELDDGFTFECMIHGLKLDLEALES